MFTTVLRFIIVLCLQTFVTLSAPMQVQAGSDRKFCDQNPIDIHKHISSQNHQFNMIGTDSDFDDFTSELTENQVEDSNAWFSSHERRNLQSGKDSSSKGSGYKIAFCKMERSYTMRFDKFPFVKAEVHCKPNSNLQAFFPEGYEMVCDEITETRQILRLSEGCTNVASHSEESYVYSTEQVVVGCHAKIRVPRSG